MRSTHAGLEPRSGLDNRMYDFRHGATARVRSHPSAQPPALEARSLERALEARSLEARTAAEGRSAVEARPEPRVSWTTAPRR
jgi:hypothetical protein